LRKGGRGNKEFFGYVLPLGYSRNGCVQDGKEKEYTCQEACLFGFHVGSSNFIIENSLTNGALLFK
jgi:hypothetical protein